MVYSETHLHDASNVVEGSARVSRVGLFHDDGDEVGDDGQHVDDVHHALDENPFVRGSYKVPYISIIYCRSYFIRLELGRHSNITNMAYQ